MIEQKIKCLWRECYEHIPKDFEITKCRVCDGYKRKECVFYAAYKKDGKLLLSAKSRYDKK